MNQLYTIGHSTHPVENFIELLQRHAITAVADVRSSPYSRFNPQYNRENLQKALKDQHIAYVFLGRELGPRSEDPSCYLDGRVQYGQLAKTELFRQGIERLQSGMKTYRIALMCAEKDPITCHRMILICRALRSAPCNIIHILEDGSLESLEASEKRLLVELKMRQLNLFDNVQSLIERAYDVQGGRIAFRREEEGEDVDREDRQEEETGYVSGGED